MTRRGGCETGLRGAVVLGVALAVVGVVSAAALLAPAAAQSAVHSTMLSEFPSSGLVDPHALAPPAGEALAPLFSFAAPAPGAGGWYWPTGSDHNPMGGWLQDRGAYVHIAVDMNSPIGHPVYAIGAGVVWKSRMDAGGYGPGGSHGGVMIIVQTTATGQQFRALYGHIYGLRYKAGQHVAAGAVIARINGCGHLHFSIHPSTFYRDGNMYAGHVPRSWTDHGGFVDPVKFLKTHPRVIPYVPPALPLVKITAANPVTVAGAVNGSAYWTETTAGGPVTYCRVLATGVTTTLAADAVLPPFDAVRYEVKMLAAPALGFTVADRLPVFKLTKPHATPAWGVAARFSATLVNAAGKPFQGGHVELQREANGKWIRVAATITIKTGALTMTYAPQRRTVLRLHFTPPAKQPAAARYLAAASPAVTLAPHVRLTRPVLPVVVAHGSPVTVTGLMAPVMKTGPGHIALVFQRLDAGTWRTVMTAAAATHAAASGYSYSRIVKLTTLGAWRVHATRPADANFAATNSLWRTFTVK